MSGMFFWDTVWYVKYIGHVRIGSYYRKLLSTRTCYAMATRSAYLVRGSDGRLFLAGKKTSSEEIGKKERAHFVRFPQTRFLNLRMLGDVGQHLGRENGCV